MELFASEQIIPQWSNEELFDQIRFVLTPSSSPQQWVRHDEVDQQSKRRNWFVEQLEAFGSVQMTTLFHNPFPETQSLGELLHTKLETQPPSTLFLRLARMLQQPALERQGCAFARSTSWEHLLRLVPHQYTFFQGYRVYFHRLSISKFAQYVQSTQVLLGTVRKTEGKEEEEKEEGPNKCIQVDKDEWLLRVTAQPALEAGEKQVMGFARATWTPQQLIVYDIKVADLPLPFSYAWGKTLFALLIRHALRTSCTSVAYKGSRDLLLTNKLKRFGFQEVVGHDSSSSSSSFLTHSSLATLAKHADEWAHKGFLLGTGSIRALGMAPSTLFSKQGLASCVWLFQNQSSLERPDQWQLLLSNDSGETDWKEYFLELLKRRPSLLVEAETRTYRRMYEYTVQQLTRTFGTRTSAQQVALFLWTRANIGFSSSAHVWSSSHHPK